MTGRVGRRGGIILAAIAAGALCAGLAHAQPHGGAASGAHAGGVAHQHFDAHFSHNQYYYDRGYALRQPPAGGVGGLRSADGARYYFHGGNWYRWRGGWYRWWGGGWVVWAAPVGLFVPFLPPYYTTIWWNGVPYYYANDVYYMWDDTQQQYEVVPPPEGIEAPGASPPTVNSQLFVYPKNGQSPAQQGRDQHECERWAVSQTGFDPATPGAGAGTEQAAEKRADFLRAQTSCLEGRGYSVR